jgi:VWFA-related protein
MKAARLIFCLATVSLGLQARPPQLQQAPQPSVGSGRPRLVCLFLDLNSVDATDQSKARDNAIKFVQELAAPSDLVQIVTYTSKLNVIQEFTGDHDSLLTALRTIEPTQSGNSGTVIGANDVGNRIQAIQTAVSSLSRFPAKKALIYFSSVMPLPSVDDDDDHSALKDAVKAANRANVSVYSPDLRSAPRQ